MFPWNSLNLEFWLLSRPISWNSSPFNSMHFRHFYSSGISENRYSTKEFRHRKIKVIRAWMFAKKETAIHAQNKNVLVSTHWKQELYLNVLLALRFDFGHLTNFSGKWRLKRKSSAIQLATWVPLEHDIRYCKESVISR